MTRTDVMASSRPRTAGAAHKRNGSRATRWLTVLPILLMLGMALLVPAAALAETSTNSSGYEQEPNKPKTTTTEAKKETEPSKEKTEPAKEATPTSTTSPEAAKTLPFTGFDLRWSFAIGLLLVGAGFSIVVVQRRQRSDDGR